ncbi:MAG: hypothetical protein ACREFB_01840 [Stellaceae bacterium]
MAQRFNGRVDRDNSRLREPCFGDVANPRGGIRAVIPDKANY